MSKKDLTSHSTVPPLLYHYQNAHAKLIGCDVYIPKKHHGRFVKFEQTLRKVGISAHDYAYGVLPLIEWMRQKTGSKTVPINTFLSKYALDKYQANFKGDFERTTTAEITKGELMQAERMAVDYLIACKEEDPSAQFSIIVEDLRGVLPVKWWEMYDNHERTELETKMLDELTETYGYILDYDEIQLQ